LNIQRLKKAKTAPQSETVSYAPSTTW